MEVSTRPLIDVLEGAKWNGAPGNPQRGQRPFAQPWWSHRKGKPGSFICCLRGKRGGVLGRGGPSHISIISACKVFGAQTHMHTHMHTPSNVIPLALPKAENLETGRAKPLTGTTCDPWPRFKVQGAPFLAPVFFIRRQPGSPGCIAGPRAQQGKRQGKMCQWLTAY